MSIRFLRNALPLGALAFLLLPAPALAALEITDVMYDVPGSDTGREWIALRNTGTDPVDLTGWKLFEEGVNHQIKPVASVIIPPGGTATIVDSLEKFLADHPSYSGLLFDSSFSLKNSGETIALKDASGTIVVSQTYEPEASAPKPKAVTAPPPQSRNLPLAPQVSPKTEEGAPGAAQEASVIEAPAPDSFGILPWIAGLLAVVVGAVTAILWARPEKPEGGKTGYSIIEEKQ